MIKVSVIGGLGKMGQETIKAVSKEKDMEIFGIVDAFKVGEEVQIGDNIFKISEKIEDLANSTDVFIDFTNPKTVKQNADKVISLGKDIIVGATGLSESDMEDLKEKAEKNNTAIMIIPNFAIGAVLMMEVSKKIAKYMNEVEIIEYHHPNKLDAPSGTAIKTAQLIKEAKEAREIEKGEELIKGARGAKIDDINIHSVRLNGYIASQEVIFGGLGQTLSVRHDSINRESFMPGVIMCVRKIKEIRGLIYGLEKLL